ncbi:MAG: hypothetical protein R2932_00935 [Caldilineaceae bacterium]
MEVQAITEAESNGGGYGWLLAAIGIIIFAGVLFVALVGVTLGGM